MQTNTDVFEEFVALDAYMKRKSMDVLIVEDDSSLSRVLEIQLRVDGFSVRTALSAKEALDMIRQQVPSVLVLEAALSDMNGLELLAELRKNPNIRAIPTIIHTTRDLSKEERDLIETEKTRIVKKTTAFSYRLADVINDITTTN